MDRSKNKNSSLKTPLNYILGSKGHIMVLRELSKADNPMSHSELLNRTNLSRQGVYDVVGRLVETGIIAYVGSGKQQQVELRQNYPLTDFITTLFSAEKKHFKDLINRLQKELKKLDLKPKSAWIFGKVAQGSDDYGDPVRIALLENVRTIDKLTNTFRAHIFNSGIEKKFDVTIEVSGVTLADLDSYKNDKKIILLWGPSPHHYLENSKPKEEIGKTHHDFERQSLIHSEAWAELLKKNPEIIQRTIHYLKDRSSQTRSGEKGELQEWIHILESMSFQRLKKFLESDSERSTRLRQSLPFWPVLNEDEQAELEKLKSELESTKL